MRPLWTGSIAFGLVNIPVRLFSASQPSELDLDMLDAKDRSRIRFHRVNENTGKEVPRERIVRAYDLEGRYVVLDENDLKNVVARVQRKGDLFAPLLDHPGFDLRKALQRLEATTLSAQAHTGSLCHCSVNRLKVLPLPNRSSALFT